MSGYQHLFASGASVSESLAKIQFSANVKENFVEVPYLLLAANFLNLHIKWWWACGRQCVLDRKPCSKAEGKEE